MSDRWNCVHLSVAHGINLWPTAANSIWTQYYTDDKQITMSLLVISLQQNQGSFTSITIYVCIQEKQLGNYKYWKVHVPSTHHQSECWCSVDSLYTGKFLLLSSSHMWFFLQLTTITVILFYIGYIILKIWAVLQLWILCSQNAISGTILSNKTPLPPERWELSWIEISAFEAPVWSMLKARKFANCYHLLKPFLLAFWLDTIWCPPAAVQP